jgi:hypothetical protein
MDFFMSWNDPGSSRRSATRNLIFSLFRPAFREEDDLPEPEFGKKMAQAALSLALKTGEEAARP